MFFENGKYYPTIVDLSTGVLHCPECSNVLEPRQNKNWAGYVCSECPTQIKLSRVAGLPNQYRDAFKQNDEMIENIESLKSVVDELQDRGETQDAYALANLITLWTPSNGVVFPTHVVEVCRLLDLAEEKVFDMALASRISLLKHEIQKGVLDGNSQLQKSSGITLPQNVGTREESGSGDRNGTHLGDAKGTKA